VPKLTTIAHPFKNPSANRSVAVNVPGDQVFKGAGLPNGQDIFDIILDLETALQNNDVAGPDGIRSQIGRFDKAIDQILGFRAEFGARMNNTQMAKDALSVIKVRTVEQRSQIEDADVLETYSDLVRYQQAFQAALQSTAQVIQPSLLDFLQ
jgi:flagellar hook-associated protein 3 FlgL